METTGMQLDRTTTVHTNKSYTIETSNDNGMRRQGSHIFTSEPPTSIRKSKLNELHPSIPPPPPDPPPTLSQRPWLGTAAIHYQINKTAIFQHDTSATLPRARPIPVWVNWNQAHPNRWNHHPHKRQPPYLGGNRGQALHKPILHSKTTLVQGEHQSNTCHNHLNHHHHQSRLTCPRDGWHQDAL